MHGQISHLLQRKNGRISNSRTRMANALTSVHLSIHSPISVQATWHWRRGRWPIISANEQPPQRLPQRREPQWGSGSGGSSSPKYAGASAAGSIVCNRREGMLQSGNDTHTHTQAHTSTHKHTHTNTHTQTYSHNCTHIITRAQSPQQQPGAQQHRGPSPQPSYQPAQVQTQQNTGNMQQQVANAQPPPFHPHVQPQQVCARSPILYLWCGSGRVSVHVYGVHECDKAPFF